MLIKITEEATINIKELIATNVERHGIWPFSTYLFFINYISEYNKTTTYGTNSERHTKEEALKLKDSFLRRYKEHKNIEEW